MKILLGASLMLNIFFIMCSNQILKNMKNEVEEYKKNLELKYKIEN